MKILLTGDSIIARHEGKKEPHLKIINTAVAGINSRAFLLKLNKLVLSKKICDALVILLGTNDLAVNKQIPLQQFKQNMKLISLALIHLYRPEKIILVSPPAIDEQRQYVRTNKLIKKYSAVIKEVAAEYNFHYLNLFQAMLDHGNLNKRCCGIRNDGLHFGDEGYEFLSILLRQELTVFN